MLSRYRVVVVFTGEFRPTRPMEFGGGRSTNTRALPAETKLHESA